MGWVLHVDLDQFIAAVEVLRRPELAGRPVVVGGRGDPTERGVVSTASYEARRFGVGSGMPLRVAVRKLSRGEAVFLPVDGPAYDAASAEVMAPCAQPRVGRRAGRWSRCSAGTRRSSGPVRITATSVTRSSSRSGSGPPSSSRPS